ncbi:MAG TPA: single-stranded DNA-binding protein [Acidimicrobiales bacterium]|nr:single-stranded DNA-binding protein [Acidimicrobiales bacterium]
MNSINLIGRLTADPELRFTGGGTPACTIRIAVHGRRRTPDADPRPLFINVVTYGAQAEAVAKFMVKGRPVAVTGRLEYREWRGHDNVPHSIYEVIASQVGFLDAPPTNGESTYGDDEEPF